MYSRLSSTSDEDSDLIIKCDRKKQKKVAEYHWSDVTPQNVTCLRIGTDGLQVYILNSNSNDKTNGLVAVQRSVRFGDCKGSHKCVNESCPFKVQFDVLNTRQFEKKKGFGLACKGCGAKAIFVQCFARRHVSTSDKQTKVYHYGKHTCPIIKPVIKNTAEVLQLLRNNPNIKPSEI